MKIIAYDAYVDCIDFEFDRHMDFDQPWIQDIFAKWATALCLVQQEKNKWIKMIGIII